MAQIGETFTAQKWGDEWKQIGLTTEDLKEFCVSEGHPLFLMSSGSLLMTYELLEKRGRAVAAMQHDGHCCMLRNARCLASWNTNDTVDHERSKLQQRAKSSLPPGVGRKAPQRYVLVSRYRRSARLVPLQRVKSPRFLAQSGGHQQPFLSLSLSPRTATRAFAECASCRKSDPVVASCLARPN